MHFSTYLPVILQGLLLHLTHAQAPAAAKQSTAFNSTFALTTCQISAASLSSTTSENINNVINFDRSQLANGGPYEDDFYTLPPLTNTPGPLPPGTLLKVQSFTNTTPFVIPPNTALSRILYTTTNLNGTVIPTSAFILWPFAPRSFPSTTTNSTTNSKAPTILWTHGTSGFFASQAPSAHRALWYGDSAPFTLALAGYAVVAPDYAGLGISQSWDGSSIPHQYLASPAGAHDALYALRAALSAFPDWLGPQFVAMGHSQGGGVAWAVAELLAEEAAEFADLSGGYLGTIAGSPTTDLFSGTPSFILPWVGMILNSIFPDFDLSKWLTPLGVARTTLLQELEGGIGVSTQLYLTGETITQSSYNDTWYANAYGNLANAGRKPFKGPMLVLQGTADVYISYDVTTATVRDTCSAFPEADLVYLVVNGTGHVPTLDATRQVWLGWIEDRFGQKALSQEGCVTSHVESLLPIERYLSVGNSFPQWAGATEYSYETVLGL